MGRPPRPSETREPPGWAIAGVCAVGVLALLAVLFAYVTQQGACDYGGCQTPAMYDIQFAVACAGLIPVGVLVWATAGGQTSRALAALLIAVIWYAVWGVLNDRAVHPSRPGAMVLRASG